MAGDNVAVVRGIYEAFAKGDVPSVLGAFDPGISWEESTAPGHPWGGINTGPDNVLNKVFMQIMGNFDSFSVVPTEYVGADDRVFALGTITGTAKATSKSFSADFCHILTVKDGKVTRFQGIEDSAAIMSTLS